MQTIALVGLAIVLLAAPAALSARLGSPPIEDESPPVGGGTSAEPPAANPTGSFDDGTVLVGFSAGTTDDEKRAVVAAAGAVEERVIGAGTHVLRVPNGQVGAKIALLKKHGKVRYAEPDYVVRADMTPNDRYYRQLWGMSKIHMEQAWDVTTGSQGVVVGVVDTGIDYNHPDLGANIWTNPGSVNGCVAGTHGYNAITATCDPLDDHNHGTHVSGTIGAVGNNNVGVIGVNSSVKVMGLKFLNSGGSGSTSGGIAAIDWAVKAKIAGVNVRVLSNSWGGGGYSQALRDEIAKAGAYDILFVAAAGNNASNVDAAPFYPCSYGMANEICVAATDKNDSLASFSNYGQSSVDMSSPGYDILSTIRGGLYGTMSGTSMATPHVSGAAALVLATGYQSVSSLKATMLAAVDPVGSQAGLTRTGGRLNVCKALPACSGVTPPPPTPPPPPPLVGDFSIDASPGRDALRVGASTSYGITVTPAGGFTGSVALTVSGLPPGGSGSFAPTPVSVSSTSPTSSTLSVTTTDTTPPDRYTLTITGTSGSLTHIVTVVLQVKRK